jgi:hypothetical protein
MGDRRHMARRVVRRDQHLADRVHELRVPREAPGDLGVDALEQAPAVPERIPSSPSSPRTLRM